jgi:hypothetical protein
VGSLVGEAGLQNDEVIIVDKVDELVFLVDPSRPVSSSASYSARNSSTASPRREWISIGVRSSLTFSISGDRFLRASLAVVAMRPPSEWSTLTFVPGLVARPSSLVLLPATGA